MSLLEKIIGWSYVALFLIVPLIFLSTTSELFEFNKLLATYAITSVILVAWLGRMIENKKFIFKKTWLDLPLLIFLASQLISTIFSIDPHTSIFGYYGRWNGGLLSLVAYALLYWGYVSNIDSSWLKKHLIALLSGSILVSIYGVAQHFGVDAHIWVQDVQNRVFSTLGQPNWLAAYLIALIFLPLSVLFQPKTSTNTKVIHFSIFILLFITLIFTKSRSGFLGFGISFFIFCFSLLLHKHTRVVQNLKLLSIIIPILALFTLLIKNPLQEYIFKSAPTVSNNSGLEGGGTESGEIRKIVWLGGLEAWLSSTKNLFLGSGPETFALIYYQHRPLAHNNTSEWELLYNKAHNEFINYLTTTGLIGFLSYLFLLGTMAYSFVRFYLTNHTHKASNLDLILPLGLGWLTLSVTNFWGFSVIVPQLLLFLLPAMSFVSLQSKSTNTKTPSNNSLAFLPLLLLLPTTYLIGRYWLADYNYAASQKDQSAFISTSDSNYLISSYEHATQAYTLNSSQPDIAAHLGEVSAFMSIAVSESSSTTSAQLAQTALNANQTALKQSPYHPSWYKSLFRTSIILATLDPKYFAIADEALVAAIQLSPTDPRLWTNRAVVAKYQANYPKSQDYLAQALKLKPDFADALALQEEVASLSAKQKNPPVR